MNDHARFAPSAAHRWLNCTASVDVGARYEDPPSEAAQEGSAAHFLLERCLIDGGEPLQHLGRTISVKERGVERKFVVTRDMARDVTLAVETIREIASHPGVSGVEARVDLSFLDAGQFGTCDLWHWGQDGVLTIVDFKYGRRDVEAERNDQLMIYATGVWKRLLSENAIKPMYWIARNEPAVLMPLPHTVHLIIIQPRSIAPTPRVKRWSFPASECEAIAQRAFEAITEANRFPRFVPGAWCEHCPALGECEATKANTDLAALLQTVDMTVADAERILRKKDLLETIVERAEKVMLDALMNGYKSEFPLVTKTKHRQWRDEDLARQNIVEEIGPEALDTPTPATVEKLGPVGKEIAKRLAFSPPGEAALGKIGDKRAPYLARSAETMFPNPPK